MSTDSLPFTILSIGFRPCIVLGNYTVAEIPFAFARIDLDGRILARIVDALNQQPEIAVSIVQALFPSAPAPAG